MLAPTVDSDKTDAEGHRPWCEDEAALSGLGVAAPWAMTSPIAAGHYGVPFSLKYYESGNNWQWGSWKSAGSLLESFQFFACFT